jgi:hypothetical protein
MTTACMCGSTLHCSVTVVSATAVAGLLGGRGRFNHVTALQYLSLVTAIGTNRQTTVVDDQVGLYQ